MGLARDLTMGTRTRRRSAIATSPDYTALKRMLDAEHPNVDTLRAVLDRIGAQPERPRFKEGALYIAGCERLRELTGQPYGPVLGTY